jgi:hypothetical protein
VGQKPLDDLNLASCRHRVDSAVKHASLGKVFNGLSHYASLVGRASSICCGHVFFLNNCSATVTQRVFRRHFDIGRNGKVPTRQTILNWVTQFRTTAAIVNKKPSGRPRTVRTPEIVRRVSHAFQRSPQRSARRHLVALHLSPKKCFHRKRSMLNRPTMHDD